MNKLALSIAIAAITATAAQAKTVYEEDGMALNLTGEVAFEATRDVDDGDELATKTDNVDLEVKAIYDLENGVEIFGFYALEMAGMTEEASAGDFLKDHYIGVTAGNLHARYGDQDYAIDDFGIGGELDSATGRSKVISADDSAEGGSEEVLYVKYSTDMVSVAASIDFAESDDETSYDIYVEAEPVEDVIVGAGYSIQEWNAGANKETSYGASLEYTGVDSLTLGTSLVYSDDSEAYGFDALAKYTLSSAVKVAGGVGYVLPDDDTVDSTLIYFVNGNYNFTKNVDAYGEVYDEGSDQLGFVVGLSVDF